MIIGITGGTGCGKTTALQAIRQLGGMVIDCDAVYHRLLQTDKEMLRAIETRFPGVVDGGMLDRKKLAGIVFSQEQALRDLNAITHIAVKQEVLRLLQDTPPLAAIDAIELFDGNLAPLCDVTVAVTASEKDRIARLLNRDGIDRAQATARIRAQKPEAYFRRMCDYVLENSGTAEDFLEKCLVFFKNLTIIKERPVKE
ncbi:MAG: dephospho-CoA kinase [Oscillospiraceae bacterium]|nr:dephospho-CoA kinase [Oscillospiraceae bacterium]